MSRYPATMSLILFCTIILCMIASFRAGFFDTDNVSMAPHPIAAYSKDTEIEQYNQDGLLSKAIKAPLVEQQDATNRTLFFHPNIVTYNTKRTPWHITSKRAELISHRHRILLNHNVTLKEMKKNKTVKTTINTDAMHYDTQRKIATSHDLTTVKQYGTTASGHHVDVDFNTGNIHIKKQTTGHYTPTQ